MPPAPIRKPPRGEQGNACTRNAAGRAKSKDKNRFINVSEYVAGAIEMHNGDQAHKDSPDMKYIDFPYEADSRERNRKALQIVGEHLERMLHYEEGGTTKCYYGEYTFSELPMALRDKVEEVITAHPDMKVFTQGENNWIIKTFIEQKMASKSRQFRRKSKNSKSNKNDRAVTEVIPSTLDRATSVVKQFRAATQQQNPEPSTGEEESHTDAPQDDIQTAEDEVRSRVAAGKAIKAFQIANDDYQENYQLYQYNDAGGLSNETGPRQSLRNDYNMRIDRGSQSSGDDLQNRRSYPSPLAAKSSAGRYEMFQPVTEQHGGMDYGNQSKEITALKMKIAELEKAQLQEYSQVISPQQPSVPSECRVPTGRTRLTYTQNTGGRGQKRVAKEIRNRPGKRIVRGKTR